MQPHNVIRYGPLSAPSSVPVTTTSTATTIPTATTRAGTSTLGANTPPAGAAVLAPASGASESRASDKDPRGTNDSFRERNDGSIASFYAPGSDYVHLPPVPPAATATAGERRKVPSLLSPASAAREQKGDAAQRHEGGASQATASQGGYGALPPTSSNGAHGALSPSSQGDYGAVPHLSQGGADDTLASPRGNLYAFFSADQQSPSQGTQAGGAEVVSAEAAAEASASLAGGADGAGRPPQPSSTLMVRDDGTELLVHDVSDV